MVLRVSAVQSPTHTIEEPNKTVFIAGHVPLHFTARTSSMHSTGDNLYLSLIFDEVNTAGEYLNIVYLSGHNHSKGWDCYLGGGCVFKDIGDSIQIPVYSDTEVTLSVKRNN